MHRSHNIVRVLTRQAHSGLPSSSCRYSSSSSNGPRIFLSKDETCFVSYHPQAEFPYDCTRPLPKVEAKHESHLKVDATNMITKAPNLDQLQELTYTHKRHWLNYQGKAKRNKYKAYFNDNVDRKGLTT